MAEDDGVAAERTGNDGGTYTLVLELAEPATIDVGALGALPFESEWYAYTGSAFGPGGFSRVERHYELAAGDRDTRHWHVDYLLGHDAVTVDRVVRSPGVDVECAVSDTIASERVPGFGASDCDCDSHLAYSPDRADLLRSVEQAHEERG